MPDTNEPVLNEIEKELAADEAKLAELQKEEEAPAPDPKKEKPEPKEEEPVVEEKPKEEEPPDEEPKPEEAPKEELSPSAAAFAKERREKREMAAKIKLLEEKAAQVAQPVKTEEPKPVVVETEKPAVDAEPNKTTDYEAWLEWRDRQVEQKAVDANRVASEVAESVKEIKEWREQQQKKAESEALVRDAVSEFVKIEESYKAENPDYGNAMEYGRKKYGDAIRLLNPNKTDAQVEAELDQSMLWFAAQAKTKGLNPAEELYDLAIERFGYVPNVKEEIAELEAEVEPAPKPNLAKIQANRKKSLSGLSGGGQGGSQSLTAEDVANMTNAEFSRLTPSQLRALEGGN